MLPALLLSLSFSGGPALRLSAARSAVARTAPPVARSWTQQDMKTSRVPLPDEVEELISADTNRQQTEMMWSAFRGCYATESDAIAAAMRNTGAILPYLNSPGNIKGCFQYLSEELGENGARDVVTKNPGVLSCAPAALRQTAIEDIQKAADTVDAIESLPIPPALRQNADKLLFFALAIPVYLRIQACAGQTCGAQ